MQNRKRVPLFPLGSVINRGKSFAPNIPQTGNDSMSLLGSLCPQAEVLAVLCYPPAQGA